MNPQAIAASVATAAQITTHFMKATGLSSAYRTQVVRGLIVSWTRIVAKSSAQARASAARDRLHANTRRRPLEQHLAPEAVQPRRASPRVRSDFSRRLHETDTLD